MTLVHFQDQDSFAARRLGALAIRLGDAAPRFAELPLATKFFEIIIRNAHEPQPK
ncbi:MAG: hypothetical protein AAB354_04105 [candidate division KSB1 bacterium]